eukprot:scaffold74760_cov36-Cyclotella_meneghiniana.AAC.1
MLKVIQLTTNSRQTHDIARCTFIQNLTTSHDNAQDSSRHLTTMLTTPRDNSRHASRQCSRHSHHNSQYSVRACQKC